MLIIPAINLLHGNVVRLRQGDPSPRTVYSDDPLAVARHFVEMGVRYLYVNDLDSLHGDTVPHLNIAASIASAVDAQVQFSAVIRAETALNDVLEQPFARIVLRGDHIAGTAFARDALRQHAERLTVRLDVRDGKVQLDTPEREGPEVADPVALALEFVELGARRLLYSDLNRDGMLGGPNYAGLRALLGVAGVPVSASGGIAHSDHIRNLERLGVEAVIIGKALYTGDLTLRGHLDEAGHWKR